MDAGHVEIERKFLVADVPPDLAGHDQVEMRQGYLVVDEGRMLSVRLRQEGERYRLAIKQGSGGVRTEVELEMDAAGFDALWPLAREHSLEKVRYMVPLGPHVVELDVYRGALAPLVVAEVEFASEREAAAFRAPGWLGREVSDDPRYLNQNLARYGIPEEPE